MQRYKAIILSTGDSRKIRDLFFSYCFLKTFMACLLGLYSLMLCNDANLKTKSFVPQIGDLLRVGWSFQLEKFADAIHNILS